MFTAHSERKEERHSLPPLSQIISNVLPFQQQQQQQQHQHQHPLQHQPQQYSPSHEHHSSPIQKYTMRTPPQEYKQGSMSPRSLNIHTPISVTKCTCKQEPNHIPRPRNAFILFRQQHHQSVLDEGDSVKTNPDVSRELGKRWRDLSSKQKEYWNKLAEEEKKKHAEKYPGYRYIPRRFGKKNKCPTCKSRAHIKEVNAHEQRLRLLDLQEEELKARLASFKTHSSHVPPSQLPPQESSELLSNSSLSPQPPSLTSSASTTPQESVGFFNGSASSEEHAVAQSFLSLRNQQQREIYYTPHYHNQQLLQQTPLPQQTYYYQQAVVLPQLTPPLPPKTSESGLPIVSSTTGNKICSIANFLN